VAAHKATLRRTSRDGGEDVGPAGAVDEAAERPDVSAEADAKRALAINGAGDLEAVEAVSIAAAVAFVPHVLAKEKTGAGIMATYKAIDDNGREAGDKDYAEDLMALNEAGTMNVGASASRRRVSGSTFKGRGAAASDDAGTGTRTNAAAGLSICFLEGDKNMEEIAAALDVGATGTKSKAADGVFKGEGMHGKKFKVKREAAAGAAVGAFVVGKEGDAGDLMAKQLAASELKLDKGYTEAQFEGSLKTVNIIGTVAAPLKVQLANIQAITIDDRTRAILMSRKQHYVQKRLCRTAQTYRGALRWAADCKAALDAISSQAKGVLPSTAVASTRMATRSLCKLCSVSLTTDWQAGSAPVSDALKAGAASHVDATDDDCDENIVFVGLSMDGDRAFLNMCQN